LLHDSDVLLACRRTLNSYNFRISSLWLIKYAVQTRWKVIFIWSIRHPKILASGTIAQVLNWCNI